MLCVVFKSTRKADTYLYMPVDGDFEALPEGLQHLFSARQEAMRILVKADRKFARFSGAQLLEQLNEEGYYLQLPPAHDAVV
ncbi:YcgL domain-containing protein [Aliidiomarina celeris]|uniref:YcgL domain-containing protein n=1 Tax=Aliidiomarina celeris TaxID=2249428 RepID=UPI000DEBF0CC|nr:YcgL domain-containing protein [Aliidiomarina celeris]